ncbi:hypothetical protein [uncultured Croceitalea sp.]|uniref:hypothetical protein n=1 Tax=uncultured Croceitalea sp. TaxID=1798908 RepID=UPI00374FAEBA
MNLPKTYEEFKLTLNLNEPNSEWELDLQSIWYAAKDNWSASHRIAQDLDTIFGYWIHGYLHRIEDDKFNAMYWYEKANKPFSRLPFEDELKEIIIEILKHE